MGGGTGTGASSVVAEVAREMDILTVGIVTIPFAFEGTKKIKKAMTGVAQLAEHVDAILVINNEKLREIYPDFTFLNAFSKSDDVVANAARSIAEIITVPGIINTDFTDVFNTLSNSNVAIMSVGSASGEDRINQSIHEALTSPLVNSDVKGAKRVLLQLYCSSEHPIIMQEFDHIHAFVHAMGDEVEVQWGVSLDENLGEKVRVTLIATGFEVSDIPGLDDAVGKKTVDQAIEKFYGESNAGETIEDTPEEPVAAPTEELTIQDSDVIINLDEDLLPSTPIADNHPRPVTPEPTREDATWSRSGIAGWMRGRR
jgi:cell division protein FtsZ